MFATAITRSCIRCSLPTPTSNPTLSYKTISKSLRLLTPSVSRDFTSYSKAPRNSNRYQDQPQYRSIRNMAEYSNTDTGSKPADPYKEKNLEEPGTKEKIDDLVSFAERSKFCMMTTRIAPKGLLVSRCMAVAAKEGNGIDLIFHANTESGKTDDLESDPKINLAFLNNSGEWASISGEATVVTDRDFIHKYYSPALKAWLGDLGDGKHDGSPDDPRICAIKVKAITAQYAISRRTAVGGFIELAKGVATGEAPSVNKLRYIDEDELQKYRTSQV